MRASLPVVLLLVLGGATSGAGQPAAAALAGDHSPGARVYRTVCAVCHQPDGSGAPNLQPALRDDPVVAGDSARLIRILLRGPAAVLPPGRPHYQNVMPAMAGLPDRDLANVLTFVRKAFGHGAPPVTVAEVAAQRAVP